eukprot:4891295-Pyramimonas_sp.AAC.1
MRGAKLGGARTEDRRSCRAAAKVHQDRPGPKQPKDVQHAGLPQYRPTIQCHPLRQTWSTTKGRAARGATQPLLLLLLLPLLLLLLLPQL